MKYRVIDRRKCKDPFFNARGAIGQAVLARPFEVQTQTSDGSWSTIPGAYYATREDAEQSRQPRSK